MSDKGFNGSSCNFNGALLSPILSMQSTNTAAAVQVSGAGTAKKYVAGDSDKELSVTIAGGTTVAVGNTGAITVTWNDGTTDSYGSTVVCTGVSFSGSQDAPITTTVTLKPAT